jgi:hypothetical protein
MKSIPISLLLFAPIAAAQNFSVDWFTVDGGGGTSAAGSFAVSGTVAQPDSGSMSGGAYSVVGGFWSFAAAETLALAVSNSPTGVVVYWNRPANNWVLDESPILLSSPPHPWAQVAFPYETNATHIYVTVPAPAAHKFYRLRKL